MKPCERRRVVGWMLTAGSAVLAWRGDTIFSTFLVAGILTMTWECSAVCCDEVDGK